MGFPLHSYSLTFIFIFIFILILIFIFIPSLSLSCASASLTALLSPPPATVPPLRLLAMFSLLLHSLLWTPPDAPVSSLSPIYNENLPLNHRAAHVVSLYGALHHKAGIKVKAEELRARVCAQSVSMCEVLASIPRIINKQQRVK